MAANRIPLCAADSNGRSHACNSDSAYRGWADATIAVAVADDIDRYPWE